MLSVLEQVKIPEAELPDLAQRFEGIQDIPATLPPPPSFFQAGDTQVFWASNDDTNNNFQVNATLEYVTPHVYFWVQDGVRYNQQSLQNLADTFENKIYPTDREFFGSEWTPGIDGDPHLYILYAKGLGKSVAGYFNSTDEYTPQVAKYSNAHEMFYLNADAVNLAQEFTYGVLAHEFQHMIPWNRNRQVTAWLNEGFSEVASLLNGYYTSNFDFAYASNPDIQLIEWPEHPLDPTPYYGGSFLFLTYFLDRFGEPATQALVGNPGNDLNAVDSVLQQIGAKSPDTGAPLTADDVYLDWAVTNYAQEGSYDNGRYTYTSQFTLPTFKPTTRINNCPTSLSNQTVHQYGVDYIRITCSGSYTLHFQGATQVNMLPVAPYSGIYAFWSNKSDGSDMTLTHTFDFTNQSGPITLKYHTWYEIEQDFDYVYLAASLDGKTWQTLRTPGGTDQNISGSNLGWGYTGHSGGSNTSQWIEEDVDLSEFAGKKVQLRFEYVTDGEVTGDGFLLDDVSIPQINYFSNFELDNGGWEANGWVRIQNTIPQTFRLALITDGKSINITDIPVKPDGSADIPISIGNGTQEAILVVVGTERYTRQEALYQIAINK